MFTYFTNFSGISDPNVLQRVKSNMIKPPTTTTSYTYTGHVTNSGSCEKIACTLLGVSLVAVVALVLITAFGVFCCIRMWVLFKRLYIKPYLSCSSKMRTLALVFKCVCRFLKEKQWF